MQRYTGSVIRKFDSAITGNIATGILVTVRNASDNTLATLYSTNSVSSPTLANPLSTDVNGQFWFYAADGKYNISYSNGAPSILAVQLKDTDTQDGNAITLEQFNILSGSGGNDTAAWTAACAESVATGKGIQLLNKTYLIESRTAAAGNYTFKNFLRGMGDTLIKGYTSPVGIPAGGSNTWPIILPLSVDNVTISDFKMDGNISEDPLVWATGYDSFTGNRGLVLENSDNNIIRNVRTENTMWAGIAVYRGDQNTIVNCSTTRCRGNFGDGFYMYGTNFLYENCQAYDYTRIGFVVETNAGATQLSRNGKYISCRAEYGHDSSGALGEGVEGNFGFWFENCIYVDAENCEAVNNIEGGFNVVPSYISGTESSVEDLRYASFVLTNCNIKDSRYGAVINCLNEDLLNRTHIIGGSAVNVNTGIYVGTNSGFVPQTYVYIKGFDIRLSVHNIATRAVMQLAGNVEIDGMEVIFDDGFNQTFWDAGFDTNGYSTFGAFGTDSGFRFFAKKVRCFKEIAGVKTDIGVRTKFASTNTFDNLFVELERCNISQESNNVRDLRYKNCRFTLQGSDIVKDVLVYDGCTFLARRQTGSTAIVSATANNKEILFRGCTFLFDTPDDYLYIYNTSKLSTGPVARIHGCRFIRDFATNDKVIRFDGDPDFKNDNNAVFNLEIHNCTFENTGGSTSNPILLSGFADVDLATVYGTGNYKSPTLTVDTSGFISSYF